MTPEEKVQWKERLKNARKGFYTPLGLVDTISLPSVNGGALFFSSGADPTNGTVYVESKDMPSIMKLVPAGESTAANTGGTIPSRPSEGCVRAGLGRSRHSLRRSRVELFSNRIARFVMGPN